MDLGEPYYNTNMQVEALEQLLAALPDPDGPAPAPTKRPSPARPHQLQRRITTNQRAEIAAAYDAGASAKQLAIQWQLAKASILSILRDAGYPHPGETATRRR